MTDSWNRLSFREGWLPIGRSPDATANLVEYAREYVTEPRAHYYYKPLETFDVPDLTLEGKFEDIDSYIVEALNCDPDDIITLGSANYRGLIVLPARVLRRAGLNLPRWREPKIKIPSTRPHLTLVPA